MTSSNLVEDIHIISPQEETTMKGNKRVTFYQKAQCKFVISRTDYSKEEAHSSWISDDDMKKMTERCSRTVERMESGKNSRRGSTYRGLEYLSRKGESELMGIVRECVDAVMDEQDRQYYLGVQDQEMIALASLQSSKESLDMALKRGRSDAREAKRSYRRLRDLQEDEDDEQHHNKNHRSSSRSVSQDSNSSISISDEHHNNILPILKTGGNSIIIAQEEGDIRESSATTTTMQALDVLG